jgi:hypothetical protein
MVTSQVPEPVQPPLQPPKIELLSGVAVKVTEVLGAKLAEHLSTQSMSPGEPVTLPVPVPFLLIVSVLGGSFLLSPQPYQKQLPLYCL